MLTEEGDTVELDEIIAIIETDKVKVILSLSLEVTKRFRLISELKKVERSSSSFIKKEILLRYIL